MRGVYSDDDSAASRPRATRLFADPGIVRTRARIDPDRAVTVTRELLHQNV